ncbi:MAG: hypothetical protein V2J07_04930 [Anaerolineae bacterium]|jgi:hypothetical protein|nr:hypothetical protein [Anaerolineae bacterium]
MQRKSFTHVLGVIVLAVFLTACISNGSEFLGIPLTQATPIPTITPVPTLEVMTPVPVVEETTESPAQEPVNTLLVWVPPFMDPANETLAGDLLAAKLAAFVAKTPNVEIEIRVKSEEGPASLIASLTAVSAVAPLELPSLIILDRSDLENAAKKGLILPMGDYSTIINEIGWFQYARSLSVISDSSYGLPLVGEALVMVVRPAEEPENAEIANEQLAFWPADPNVSLMLNDYLAVGGDLLNEENQVVLSLSELTSVYSQIALMRDSELLSPNLTAITSHADAWERFKSGEVNMVILPSSFPLVDLPADSRIVPLDSITDFDHTLATGWTIALVDPLPERRNLSVALAESLTEVSFLGQWSEALDMMPVRGESFSYWQKEAVAQRLSVISLSARIYPSQEIIQIVSPAMQAGLTALLTQDVSPEGAAQIAIDSLTVED